MTTEANKIRKQTIMFLFLCLPVSWLLMGISCQPSFARDFSPAALLLQSISCFIPAIAAILTVLLTNENIMQLCFFPKFQGNGKVYLSCILIGIVLGLSEMGILLLCFPDIAKLSPDASAPVILFSILLYTAYSILFFFTLMGEELGWMGFLFLRLEKLCGTGLAILFTGIIRACWHIGILIRNEHFFADLCMLCLSNILLGSVLVLFTKKSGSVIPASITHALTNTIPTVMSSFVIVNETMYQSKQHMIDALCLIPSILIGGLCYSILSKGARYGVLMRKKKTS